MQKTIRKHDMELVQIHSSGAEEWYCPTCARRFIIQWPPNYQKIVLEAGDEYAFHSCHKGETASKNPAEDKILSQELREALDDFFNELELGNS